MPGYMRQSRQHIHGAGERMNIHPRLAPRLEDQERDADDGLIQRERVVTQQAPLQQFTVIGGKDKPGVFQQA